MEEDCGDGINDVLSAEEVRSAIEALTPADQSFLLRSENLFSKINALDDAGSLLQEALVRALTLQRKCRRNLKFVPFLFGAMRSIAYSAGKSAKRSIVDPFGEIEEAEEDQVVAEGECPITPEREAAAREALQRVDELFHGDEEVRLLLEAMADGLKGAELCDALGWDETQYDTIRRRMKRKCAVRRGDLE